jgi:hypothetical protein
MGLNDKLRLAATETEVGNLMAEGSKYLDASPKTRRRWKSVAIRCLKRLRGEMETTAVVHHKAKTSSSSDEIPRNKYRQKKL